MLVDGGEDLLVRAYLDSAIDHRQAFGRAAGQGDLARFGVQVAAGPFAHLAFTFPGLLQIPIHGQAGVAVDLRAVAVNRIAHRFGVRGHQEIGKMQVVRVLGEQLAKPCP